MEDISERVKKITRMEMYAILKEFKGRKLEEKFSMLEEKLLKILMHGAQVISEAVLPIGQLSEEAAESRNKHFRKYRLDFARKFCRTDCNRDVLNRLLLTSDPLISSNRTQLKKKRKPFSEAALDMLVPLTPNLECADDEDDEDHLENSDTD